MEEIWSAALPRLRERVGERNFSVWIEPIRCRWEDGAARLELPSRFSQEWVTQHFLPAIREVLEEVAGGPCPVRLAVNARPPATPRVKVPARRAAPPSRAQKPVIGQLVPDYTFATFVVGSANDLAVRAAQTASAAPGRRFNPIFLFSGVGLGKTHLLNAIAHDLLRRWSRIRIAWLSAESFMNDLIGSLRKDRMNSFRERYRQLDALLLDDLHSLANKERTQEEFFHTFNALYASGKQIVVTSDRLPVEIAGLEQRLQSRFEGGLLAGMGPPTREMRAAMVKAKAARHGMEFPSDVVDLLASREVTNVRELEGAVLRVVAAASIEGGDVTLEMVQRAVGPFLGRARPVSVEAVQEAVSEHFGIVPADLLSHRRERRVVFPRQVAMYLSRSVAGATFPCIAEKFGGRDHSTVMYAVRVIEQKREADPAVARSLSLLESRLRGLPGSAVAGC